MTDAAALSALAVALPLFVLVAALVWRADRAELAARDGRNNSRRAELDK